MVVEPDTTYEGDDYTYLVNTIEVSDSVWEVRLRVDDNSNRVRYSSKHRTVNERQAIKKAVEDFESNEFRP